MHLDDLGDDLQIIRMIWKTLDDLGAAGPQIIIENLENLKTFMIWGGGGLEMKEPRPKMKGVLYPAGLKTLLIWGAAAPQINIENLENLKTQIKEPPGPPIHTLSGETTPFFQPGPRQAPNQRLKP